MNLISGVIQPTDTGNQFRGPSFMVDLGPAWKHLPETPVTLGLRPEHLSLQPQNSTSLHAEIRLVEPLGKDTLLYLDYGGPKPLIVVVEGTERYRTGNRMGFVVDPERCYLFGEDGQRLE